MRSYREIIDNDTFKTEDHYFVDTEVSKMCWRCETKHKSGYMVWDIDKMRRIFFCEDCFAGLVD
ncbi:MAG: hypothetical protein ACFFG0_28995 [Candidatus Thorarchaeota archaeon]